MDAGDAGTGYRAPPVSSGGGRDERRGAVSFPRKHTADGGEYGGPAAPAPRVRRRVLQGQDARLIATMYEGSKLAGVSLATVSRVMNNSGRVTDKTRNKVIAAMEELGYRPSSIAQSLASSRTNSVGILVPELHGPFFGTMLSGIEAEL